jgi:hypothetical protein
MMVMTMMVVLVLMLKVNIISTMFTGPQAPSATPAMTPARCSCHHLAGDLSGAENSLSAVIQRCPTHAHALYNRGLVRTQMQKAEAKADFEAVLECDAEFVDCQVTCDV